MGNYTSCSLITTDNKTIKLGHSKDPSGIGMCDYAIANDTTSPYVCNYTTSDLEKLLTASESTTTKIKQVIAGKGTTVYIYDQDNYTGNKYVVLPNSQIIVPPCFNIKSVKHIPSYGSDKKLQDTYSAQFFTFEPFASVGKYNSNTINNNNNNKFIIGIIILIILFFIICKRK
jgi:hypothetical protein